MAKEQTTKEVSNNELAGMINKGFTHVQKQIDTLSIGQAKLQSDVSVLKDTVESIEQEQVEIRRSVVGIEMSQQRAEADSKNYARKFETDDHELRLRKLEKTAL
jgi:septation ring formation regulator EzrA